MRRGNVFREYPAIAVTALAPARMKAPEDEWRETAVLIAQGPFAGHEEAQRRMEERDPDFLQKYRDLLKISRML